MSTTHGSSISAADVERLVRAELGAHAANGISLEVTWVDSFEEGWWRVGVRPDKAGIRADDYASLLTEVEERIRDVNGVNLVLVPVLG